MKEMRHAYAHRWRMAFSVRMFRAEGLKYMYFTRDRGEHAI